VSEKSRWQQLLSSINIQSGIGFLMAILRDYIYENTTLKVVALLIAVLFWAAVTRQENVSRTFAGVSIEYANLAPGLTISNDGLRTATVRVSGPRSKMESLRSDNLRVRLDLANTKAGERVLPLERNAVIVPSNINVLEVEPQRTYLTIEPLVIRQVKVIPRFINNLPPDYELVSYRVSPSLIKIQGPESRVNAIADAPTEKMSLAEHRASFIERPNIDIKDTTVYIVGSPTIEVQVAIEQIRATRQLTGVPVRINGSEAFSATPTTITVEVEGPRSVVVNLVANELVAVVDTSNIRLATGGKATITPQMILPPAALPLVTVKRVDSVEVMVKYNN
jgi:YbbR domain-containing protein